MGNNYPEKHVGTTAMQACGTIPVIDGWGGGSLLVPEACDTRRAPGIQGLGPVSPPAPRQLLSSDRMSGCTSAAALQSEEINYVSGYCGYLMGSFYPLFFPQISVKRCSCVLVGVCLSPCGHTCRGCRRSHHC